MSREERGEEGGEVDFLFFPPLFFGDCGKRMWRGFFVGGQGHFLSQIPRHIFLLLQKSNKSLAKHSRCEGTYFSLSLLV